MGADLVTIVEAVEILAQRGQTFELRWIQKKVADGKVPGAFKLGGKRRGLWLLPREWAETYIKDTRGRKPRVNREKIIKETAR